MKRIVKKALVRLSGSNGAQRLLQRVTSNAQYLMGIGAGVDVESSGEGALLHRMAAFHARTKQPVCIFDVGANKGQFLDAVMARYQGRVRNYRIHAFEPSRAAYDALLAKRYPGEIVSLNRVALGDKAGRASLYYDQPGSGLASLTQRDLTHLGRELSLSEEVDVLTMDQYCRERGIGHVHFLKLDVEGHELDVLRGAARMLGSGAIDAVTFEFGGCNLDTRTSLRDFWVLFQESGLRQMYRVTPSGFLAPILRYSEMHEQFQTTNYLVRRPSVWD